jgi:hypothetical protein
VAMPFVPGMARKLGELTKSLNGVILLNSGCGLTPWLGVGFSPWLNFLCSLVLQWDFIHLFLPPPPPQWDGISFFFFLQDE